MKKIVVNKDACIACGACIGQDSEHFDFDEEGLSEAISQENLDSEDLLTAMECCPTSAISFVEEDNDADNASECEDCSCCEECTCGDDCHCTKDDKCSNNCHCNEEEKNCE